MRLNKLQKTAVTALEDIKARDIKVLDVRKLTSLYDTLVIATADSNRQVNALARNVRDKLKEAADVVRVEASARFAPISAKSAAGYRIRARIGAAFVEQSLRKTTRKHPEYGRFQMRRALEPALEAKSHEVEKRLEKAVDELADVIEGGGTFAGP